MRLLNILVFACSVLTAHTQVCQDLELVLILDISENSGSAASTNRTTFDFDILKNAVTSLLQNPAVLNGINIRIGAFGYNSYQTTIIPPGSTPAEALTYIDQISKTDRGGSWTHKGLEMVNFNPTYTKNLALLVSSQGSGNITKTTSAVQAATNIRNRGWALSVIAIKGRNDIDMDELTAVNNYIQPKVLKDNSPFETNDPKGYKGLAMEFDNIVRNMCLSSSTPKTNTDLTTTRSTDGPCSQCTYERGFSDVRHPQYNDLFITCLSNGQSVTKSCPDGTMFDGNRCNHMFSISCPMAGYPPNANTNTLASGKCCNKMYRCEKNQFVTTKCGNDEAYNDITGVCFQPPDLKAYCNGNGKKICDVNLNGPLSPNDCNAYGPDPFGNPCKYMFNGESQRVAPGTKWDQQVCSLVFSDGNMCMDDMNTILVINTDSAVCSDIFNANFINGNEIVTSPRLQKNLNITASKQEVSMNNQGIVFSKESQDPFYYWYFFSNRQYGSTFALTVRFRLDSPVPNVVYDIISNSYCTECAGTISCTVTALSSNRLAPSCTFMTTKGSVSTTATIDLPYNSQNITDIIEIRVVVDVFSVYGKVYAINAANNVYQTSDFPRVNKEADAQVLTDECGLQLGRGRETHLQGVVYMMGYTERCMNISSYII